MIKRLSVITAKRYLLLILFILMSVLSFRVSVNATIIKVGDVLQDSDTGLEWLDMSFSVGISPDSIIAGSDPGGLASQGWTHASLAQISTLLMNAGLTEPFDGVQSPWNFDGADLLISLLGATGSSGNSVSIQAFAGEGPVPLSLFTPVVITSFGTHGGADLPGPSVPSSVASPNIGNWLVRSSSITQVQMQVASSSVAEEVGGASHTVTVQLNTTTGTLASAVTVDVVDLLTGSATEGAGNDYTYTTATSVTFPIGSVDGDTQTVTLTILDDTLVEGGETINLQLQNVTGPATILAGSENHQVTIIDNDVWETVYNTLLDSPSGLELFRQYRDEILSNTTKGVIYKTLLYTFSKQALQVLLSNPKLVYQAKALIEPNYGAVLDVLDGYKGIIYNTDEIVAFLDAYAKKSPLILKIFSYIVRWDMLRKQKQGDFFFGFRLK